jgi:hypothetical protein
MNVMLKILPGLLLKVGHIPGYDRLVHMQHISDI